jgi:hypothetical protein
MMGPASRWSRRTVLTASAIVAACRSTPTPPPAELERALVRAVPATAWNVSSVSYVRDPHSISGLREFHVNMGWDEYRKWVQDAFAPDWRRQDDTEGRVAFVKYTTGDVYFVTVQRLSTAPPLRVRATATGLPD